MCRSRTSGLRRSAKALFVALEVFSHHAFVMQCASWVSVAHAWAGAVSCKLKVAPPHPL